MFWLIGFLVLTVLLLRHEESVGLGIFFANTLFFMAIMAIFGALDYLKGFGTFIDSGHYRG
ncbi:MAG: hypothetical protein JJV97_03435 [SAR324 cluster bacterium]|nr:hypothetical protein [SAR324 cluster bacterium]